MGRASSAGIELSIAVVGGVLVGRWLDGRYGWDPWGTLGGVIFGSFVGFRSLWQLAKSTADEENEEEP